MCGISGFYAFSNSAPLINPSCLELMVSQMKNRGPDDRDIWISGDSRIGLAHVRLSIIDLSSMGHQPMTSSNGCYTIVFNGEIYNHNKLRSDLEKKGYQFRSRSDTEVLLALYAEYGHKCVDYLEGMFAFSIWDAKNRGIFLARDHFGIKPLYYSMDSGVLYFASQVKTLLMVDSIDKAPDAAGYVGFYLLGSVPEPHTLYCGIKSLGAGSSLWVSEVDMQREKQYWDINKSLRVSSNEIVLPSRNWLQDSMFDSMAKHMEADVTVGLFLSAGLDSSALAISGASISKNLKTLTLGFSEFQKTKNDEIDCAQKTAAILGLDHQSSYVTRNDFRAQIGSFFDAMDQPSIDGLNTFFISGALKKLGIKVGISGVGGDEWFSGYPSFADIPKLVSLPNLGATGAWLRRIGQKPIGSVISSKYAGIFEYCGSYSGSYLLRRAVHMPWQLQEVFSEDFAVEGWRELNLFSRLESTVEGLESANTKIVALEASWYMRNQLLRDADWAGMAHSVEIRTPFIDINFLRSVRPHILSGKLGAKNKIFSNLIGQNLPNLLSRPKTGFSVPIRSWLSDGSRAKNKKNTMSAWSSMVLERLAPQGLKIWAK